MSRLLGDVDKTERGFEILTFDDANGKGATLQQSSAMDGTQRGFDNPGSSYVWLGRGDTRLHLHLDQVHELVVLLQGWYFSGSFAGTKDGETP